MGVVVLVEAGRSKGLSSRMGDGIFLGVGGMVLGVFPGMGESDAWLEGS